MRKHPIQAMIEVWLGIKTAFHDWWTLVTTPWVIGPILLVSGLVSLFAVWRGW